MMHPNIELWQQLSEQWSNIIIQMRAFLIDKSHRLNAILYQVFFIFLMSSHTFLFLLPQKVYFLYFNSAIYLFNIFIPFLLLYLSFLYSDYTYYWHFFPLFSFSIVALYSFCSSSLASSCTFLLFLFSFNLFYLFPFPPYFL